MTAKKEIERRHKISLRRGWRLTGPGPARFGWAYYRGADLVYVGRTLGVVARTRISRRWRNATEQSVSTTTKASTS